MIITVNIMVNLMAIYLDAVVVYEKIMNNDLVHMIVVEELKTSRSLVSRA